MLAFKWGMDYATACYSLLHAFRGDIQSKISFPIRIIVSF